MKDGTKMLIGTTFMVIILGVMVAASFYGWYLCHHDNICVETVYIPYAL